MHYDGPYNDKNSYESLEAQGYNVSQINQLIKAQKNGIDMPNVSTAVSASTLRLINENYSHFDAKKIKIAIYCIEHKLSRKYINNDKYSYNQLSQIYDGLYKGLNVSLYDNVDNHYKYMREVKRSLLKGIDERIFSIKDIKRENIKKYTDLYFKAEKCGFDLFKYANQGYKYAQLSVLCNAHSKNLDLKKYVTVNHTYEQMDELLHCLEKNTTGKVDISKLNNLKYSRSMIKKLYEMSNDDIDISKIVTGEYDIHQINVLALSHRFGEEFYNKLLESNFSATIMNIIYNSKCSGVDLIDIVDERYASSQVLELYKVFKYNQENPSNQIDAELLLHPEYKAAEMKKYFHLLKQGNLEDYLEIANRHNDFLKDNTQTIDICVEK